MLFCNWKTYFFVLSRRSCTFGGVVGTIYVRRISDCLLRLVGDGFCLEEWASAGYRLVEFGSTGGQVNGHFCDIL